jgi:hypothetical protein
MHHLKKWALPTLVLAYHRSNNIKAKHADILVIMIIKMLVQQDHAIGGVPIQS